MDQYRRLTDWLGIAVDDVRADIAHSHDLVAHAATRLTASFDALAAHAHLSPHLELAAEALQFEDIVTQLLAGVTRKLEVLRELCQAAAADPLDPRIEVLQVLAQALLDQRKVCANSRAAGEIELF